MFIFISASKKRCESRFKNEKLDRDKFLLVLYLITVNKKQYISHLSDD